MRTTLFLAVFAAAVGRGGCDPAPYDPCEGKACGAACTLCAPDDTDCAETAVLKACDPSGACVVEGSFTCEPAPDPCAGKSCGDPCTTCDPMLGMCPAVMAYCDAAGRCDYAYPVCARPAP